MAEEEAKPVAPAVEDKTQAFNEAEEARARKRKERLEQNRISARESRKRKKTMITELQRTVITLSRENKELNERNEALRRQLMEIGTKYPNIVPMHAIMGITPPAMPPGTAAPQMPQHAPQAAQIALTHQAPAQHVVPHHQMMPQQAAPPLQHQVQHAPAPVAGHPGAPEEAAGGSVAPAPVYAQAPAQPGVQMATYTMQPMQAVQHPQAVHVNAPAPPPAAPQQQQQTPEDV